MTNAAAVDALLQGGDCSYRATATDDAELSVLYGYFFHLQAFVMIVLLLVERQACCAGSSLLLAQQQWLRREMG